VADRQEAFQVADDRHRGLQPGSVIAVHHAETTSGSTSSSASFARLAN
jgi:hypothetical protein